MTSGGHLALRDSDGKRNAMHCIFIWLSYDSYSINVDK